MDTLYKLQITFAHMYFVYMYTYMYFVYRYIYLYIYNLYIYNLFSTNSIEFM